MAEMSSARGVTRCCRLEPNFLWSGSGSAVTTLTACWLQVLMMRWLSAEQPTQRASVISKSSCSAPST